MGSKFSPAVYVLLAVLFSKASWIELTLGLRWVSWVSNVAGALCLVWGCLLAYVNYDEWRVEKRKREGLR